MLDIVHHKDKTVVYARGEINFLNAGFVRESIKHLIANNLLTELDIDMKDVKFIDSSGASALDSLSKVMKDKHGTLNILKVNHEVEFVMSLSRKSDLLNRNNNLN